MRTLGEVRAEIDAVDAALAPLVARRLALAGEVAEAKRATGRAVADPAREEAILARVAASVPADAAPAVREIYAHLFTLSRSRQEQCLRRRHGQS